MAVDWTTLCTRVGSLMGMQEDILTANGTTIPAHIATILSEYSGAPANLTADIANVPGVVTTLQQATLGPQSTITAAILTTIRDTLANNSPLPATDSTTVLSQFAQQFAADSQSFKPNVVSATPSVGGSNIGNAVIQASMVRGDGLSQQNALAETIQGVATGSASISLIGQPTAAGLSPTWPGGSGLNTTLACQSPNNGLLANGGFDSFAIADTPDSWIITSGTPGTSIKASVYTQQTITITSTSTSGSYVLAVTDLNSVVQYTAPLAYNATASQVQQAIAALNGFSGVSVTSTGTTPDFTHTVVFGGTAGDVPAMSVALNTTGLSFAFATSVHGTAGFVGLDLQLISTGSETQTLYQSVNLQPLTVYCLNFWLKANSTPAAGNLKIGLTSGIGTTYLANAQSVAQDFSIAHGSMPTAWTPFSAFFQTPAELPSEVYLKLFVSTATTSTTVLSIDQMTLVQAQELYPGGPYAAAFAGSIALQSASLTTVADTFGLAIANSQAGKFMTLFNQNFNLAGLEIVLPTSGSPTQSDSLIA